MGSHLIVFASPGANLPNAPPECFHHFLTVTRCDHLAVLDINSPRSQPQPFPPWTSSPLSPSPLPFSPALGSSLLPWPQKSRLTDPNSRHSLSKFNTREKQGSSEQTNRSLSNPVHPPPQSCSLLEFSAFLLSSVSSHRWRSYLVGYQIGLVVVSMCQVLSLCLACLSSCELSKFFLANTRWSRRSLTY